MEIDLITFKLIIGIIFISSVFTLIVLIIFLTLFKKKLYKLIQNTLTEEITEIKENISILQIDNIKNESLLSKILEKLEKEKQVDLVEIREEIIEFYKNNGLKKITDKPIEQMLVSLDPTFTPEVQHPV